MLLKQTKGHVRIAEQLEAAFQNGRIPSAYLCLGLDGVGKSTLMREFAQLINCETGDNCHTCESCRMYENSRHPDFYVIKPSGQSIRIGQIHELGDHLSLKPTYAKKRVVLVKEAHKLNHESANSFLKILEEPPLDSLIVLLTSDENLLLETIVSRCQKLYFAPLAQSDLKAIYEREFQINPTDVDFLLAYSQGRIRKKFLKKATGLLHLRSQVIDVLDDISPENLIDFGALVESWVKQDLHGYFLEFCSVIFRDILYYQTGHLSEIINQDLQDRLALLSTKYSQEQLLWCFELVVETETAINANASKALALEALILQFKQIRAGGLVV